MQRLQDLAGRTGGRAPEAGSGLRGPSRQRQACWPRPGLDPVSAGASNLFTKALPWASPSFVNWELCRQILAQQWWNVYKN